MSEIGGEEHRALLLSTSISQKRRSSLYASRQTKQEETGRKSKEDKGGVGMEVLGVEALRFILQILWTCAGRRGWLGFNETVRPCESLMRFP